MSQADLLASLQTLLPPDAIVCEDSIDAAPSGKGAYALIIHLGTTVTVSGRRAFPTLSPGWYIYAGSAYGPGGIRARLRRHFRRNKKLHWHVDRLTVAADAMAAVAITGGRECAIVSRLSGTALFRPSLVGFGSSDCRVCASHLLAYCPAP